MAVPPIGGSMDDKWPRAAIALVVFATVVVGLTLIVTQCTAAPESERPAPTQLDVVSYDAPTWAGNRVSDCWLVEDRQLHHNWWMIKLDGQWVTLDAGEMREP